MKKALVTGATGFVGGHVVRSLLERGIAVRALVRGAADLGVETARADLTCDDLTEAVAGCDVVIHCAGVVGDRVTWESGRLVNAEGTRRVARAARAANARLVHVSTLGVYGLEAGSYDESCPRVRVDEPYTDTKIEAEEIVEATFADASANYRIVRPGMIYGPKDTGMMPRLIEMMRARVPLIGSGRTHVVLVHVADVANAIVAAAMHEGDERIFNVRGPDDLTWLELASRVTKALALPPPRRMPLTVAWIIASMMNVLERVRLIGRAPLSPFVVRLLTRERTYAIVRATRALGAAPRVLVDGSIDSAIADLA